MTEDNKKPTFADMIADMRKADLKPYAEELFEKLRASIGDGAAALMTAAVLGDAKVALASFLLDDVAPKPRQ